MSPSPVRSRAVHPILVVTVLFALALSMAVVASLRADEPTAEELLLRIDDLFRGESSEGRISMRVKTARWDRTLTMKMWSKGTQKTLVQILAPAKEKGTATLKVGNNIWNYLPKVDRTIKVPASMMSASWMGSHFTNDDIVQDSRYSMDYECEIVERPKGDADGHYSIDCIPRPEAPVVWGKVVLRVRGSDLLPVEITFWDERGGLVRTMTFTDIGELGDRTVPRRMRLVPADKPQEFTEEVFEELSFDADLPDRMFTLQALKP